MRQQRARTQEDLNLKENKIEPPDVYLGATLAKIKLESGKYFCNMSPKQYVKAAVKNIEEYLARSGNILPLKCVMPLSSNYAPWLEDLPKLMADSMQLYWELIGRIRWAVDIGRL